ncbi:MAG: GCN5-related N-acetyltransferase [Pelosinus sp.]|jgi:ribosomal-protein-alanine N-acetyltransferase|nr:GCN5-related N-acetyltransferase [Pelosinus sp.]
MIELVQTVESALVKRLVELEKDAFGIGGMNEWHLVPFIRHGRVYIIRRNHKVVGLIQYMLDWNLPEKAYMVGVSVDREWRGRGVGTELLKESFNRLYQDHIKEIELTVDANNVAAVTVYEKKLGFVIAELRENEYGEGENRLVMKRLLDIDGE